MRAYQLNELKRALTNTVGVLREPGFVALFDVSGDFNEALSSHDPEEIEPYLLGAISWHDRRAMATVSAVWAQPGWGPVLYEIVMSEVNLHPHLHKVTGSAQRIWDRFADRDDVEAIIIGDQYRSYKLKNPIDTTQNERILNSVIGHDPYGERRSMLHEVSDLFLSSQMKGIYT
jgi:hypothetical protein